MFETVDPTRYFEIQGNVSEVLCSACEFGVAANQQVVAAVTGKIIGLVGLLLQASTGAIGSVRFRSASGGGFISASKWAPPNTNGSSLFLPIGRTLYYKTNVGEGLFCDVGTAAIWMDVFYVIYKPGA